MNQELKGFVYIKDMKQVNFTLTEKQEAKLRAMSEDTGLTMSDIVRRSLDEYFEKHENSKSL